MPKRSASDLPTRQLALKSPEGSWLRRSACSNGHMVFEDLLNPVESYACPYCGVTIE